MYIIAGLGNPDRKYAGTRHNIGFDVITYLSDKYDISLSKTGFKSKLGQGFIDGEKVLLMKPQTYMNLSGEAVGEAVNFYKADAASELIIVQDDIDLEPGNIRIRSKGSAGGHNGIKSVISHMVEMNLSVSRSELGVSQRAGILLTMCCQGLTEILSRL